MFKNWKAICSVVDKHFMWALALLDLTTDFGRMIVKKLPEFFTSEKSMGPYPLSVIRMLAEKDGREQGADKNIDCLCSFNRYWDEEYPMPITTFSTEPDNGFDDPMLPSEIEVQIKTLGRRAEVGDIFEWEGKKLVLLENNDEERGGCFLMYFAPVELIAVDK